jgi:SAM-dependent methyltransferase
MGLAQEIRIAASSLGYLGLRYQDPICGWRFRKLAAQDGGPPVVCPRCFSAPRNRLMWLYLEREIGLDKPLRVVHFAPERGIRRRLAASPLVDYTSVDIEPGRADITADITDLPFEDRSFDIALCSHVLEHVQDDTAAMRELARVSPTAILQHPIDPQRATTYEDPAITSPRERYAAFGQSDHVRIYGRDFSDRLTSAGFAVESVRYRDELSVAERDRYCLDVPSSFTPHLGFEGDVIYLAHVRRDS